jgi:hypothetical protein
MPVSAIPSIRAKAARQEQLARSFVSRKSAAPSGPTLSRVHRAGHGFRNIAILAAVFAIAAAQQIAQPFRAVSKEDHPMIQQARSAPTNNPAALDSGQHDRSQQDTSMRAAKTADATADAAATVIGPWLSPDGYIRLDLLPDGRYEEAWGKRDNAYAGRYAVLNASLLHFSDESGFDVHGTIEDGVLRIDAYEFRRGQ